MFSLVEIMSHSNDFKDEAMYMSPLKTVRSPTTDEDTAQELWRAQDSDEKDDQSYYERAQLHRAIARRQQCEEGSVCSHLFLVFSTGTKNN